MAGRQPQGQVAEVADQPAGDGDQPPSNLAIMALPPRSPCPARMSSPAVLEVTWCSHAAMVAASGAVPVPVLRGDLGRVQRHPADQQPPQRSDPPGADRKGDARVVRSAGHLPGEVPCVGAHRRPARSPGPLRHSGQGAAQQVRRGRGSSVPSPRSTASTASASASAQAATCGRLRLHKQPPIDPRRRIR